MQNPGLRHKALTFWSLTPSLIYHILHPPVTPASFLLLKPTEFLFCHSEFELALPSTFPNGYTKSCLLITRSWPKYFLHLCRKLSLDHLSTVCKRDSPTSILPQHYYFLHFLYSSSCRWSNIRLVAFCIFIACCSSFTQVECKFHEIKDFSCLAYNTESQHLKQCIITAY